MVRSPSQPRPGPSSIAHLEGRTVPEGELVPAERQGPAKAHRGSEGRGGREEGRGEEGEGKEGEGGHRDEQEGAGGAAGLGGSVQGCVTLPGRRPRLQPPLNPAPRHAELSIRTSHPCHGKGGVRSGEAVSLHLQS